MSLSEELKVKGMLQWKVLATFIEGSFTGAEIMRRLRLSSPGTIYPILKTLREKGLIEYALEQSPVKKVYVLSNDGIKELIKIMHAIGNKFIIRHVSSYTSSLLEVLEPVIDITQCEKVLSTLHFQSIQDWLKNKDVTYLAILEKPSSTYNLILTGLVCTFKAYGGKEADFTTYTSSLVKSLQPGGTLIMVELEKSANFISKGFFNSILGFTEVPGLSDEDMRNCLKEHNLHLKHIYHTDGMIISISTKPS